MSDQKLTDAELQHLDYERASQALHESGRAAGLDAFNRYASRHAHLVAEHARLVDVASETAKQLTETQLELEVARHDIEQLKAELATELPLPNPGLKEHREEHALAVAAPVVSTATNADASTAATEPKP